MPNPLMQILSNMGGMGGSTNMLAQLINGKIDPQSLINNLIGNNPQNKKLWEQANQIANQNGNPKAAFNQLLKQNGLEPEKLMNMINKK